MKQDDAIVAVLTGDLIGSSKMTPDQLAIVRARFDEIAEQLNRWQDGLVIGAPQFFRGDSWQLVLAEPRLFLRAAIGIRAGLRAIGIAFDTRIGIGIGRVERIHSEQVSLSVGEAFTRSGHALDGMDSSRGFRLEVPGLDDRLFWVTPLVGVCGALVNRLARRQAEVVLASLDPARPAQNVLAKKHELAAQTVSRGRKQAGFDPLVAAVGAVERVDWRALIASQPNSDDNSKSTKIS